MNANWLSNGLGGQSMFLLMLAAQKEIPASLSITGDTGGEFDRLCSNGERMTARQFFERFVLPYASAHGIEAIMVRTLDENGQELPGLADVLAQAAEGQDFDDMAKGLLIPLFTKDRTRGRLAQSCTEKMKIRAIYQEAKRRGITQLRQAIGFHAMEVHRIKARYLREDAGFSIYKPQLRRGGIMRDIKWLEHYYPAVDMGLGRDQIRAILHKRGVVYLETTECDFCPHQDWSRWNRHLPEAIEDIARLEACFGGKLFFTPKRIPLKEALAEMRQEEIEKARQGQFADFPCESGAYCGLG